MAKKNIVIGNWKMHPLTLKEAEKLLVGVSKGVSRLKKTEVVICPPFLYLEKLKKISKKISLGAQDSFFPDVGPFTGEISAEMLYNIGVKYVILGHSERRELGETNQLVNKKAKEALSAGLAPIVCVGERERDQDHGYFSIVKAQITDCLRGISKDLVSKIIVAYEPVWAISSTANRRDATAEDSSEMAIFIRKVISDLSSPEVAAKTRVIYGGSVNEKDAKDFMENGGVDGLLPGKASLNPKKFAQIVKIVENKNNL